MGLNTSGVQRVKRGRAAVLASVILILTVVSQPGFAQDNSQDDRLLSTVRRGYVNLGVLVQAVVEVPALIEDKGPFGVSLAEVRSSLYGRVHQNVSYLMQLRFNGPQSGVLDASVSYDPSDHLGIDVGRFKAPFSSEFLTPASGIDFVNRSQVSARLSPRRQDGVQVRVSADAERTFTVYAGAFNSFAPALFGSAFEHSFVSRAVYTPVRTAQSAVQIAINGATTRSRIDSITDPGSVAPAGHFTAVGADVRMQLDRWLVSGEATIGESVRDGGPPTNPWGWQATIGVMARSNMQVLARWDALSLDDNTSTQDLVILGWNWWPTAVTEIQVNYIYDVHDVGARRHAMLVNFQFGF